MSEAPSPTTSPRVPPLTLDQMEPQTREMLQRPGGFDEVYNVFATLAHHPQLLRRWAPLANHLLFKSSLPARERELVIMRAGWLAGCAYEWGQHVVIAREQCGFGEAEFMALAVGSEDPLWGPGEMALLAMAEQLYTQQFVEDDVWGALTAHYDSKQILDAVFTACNYTTLAWALNAMRVQLDASCEPPAADLPRSELRPSPELPSMAIRRPEPRLEPLPLEALDAKTAELYEKARGHLAKINVIQTVLHHPDLLRRWMPFFGHCLHKCELSLRHREMVMLRIGRLCGSGYEWAQHRPIALERGVTEGEIAAIAAGTLEGDGRIVMEAVDQLHHRSTLDDDMWAKLSAAFTVPQILDLIFIAGQYRMVSCALNTLAVQLDDYLEPYTEAA